LKRQLAALILILITLVNVLWWSLVSFSFAIGVGVVNALHPIVILTKIFVLVLALGGWALIISIMRELSNNAEKYAVIKKESV